MSANAKLSPYNRRMRFNLTLHPSTPCELIESFDVFIQRDTKALTVRYEVSGRAAEILLPEPSSPKRQDGLWHHTCFELFARSAPGKRYCELNFSPSTRWAAYEFEDYRSGMQNLPYPIAPSVRLSQDSTHLSLEAEVDYRALAAVVENDFLVALAAVIEHRDGGKSYWALAHPSEKPDFHHPASFMPITPSGVSR